jgi:isoquinoline 1-oxidoreductase beta subunit
MSEGVSRRGVLQAGAALGGGLLIGFRVTAEAVAGEGGASAFHPNAWLRIAPDDRITFLVDKAEMGQGVMTSLPMLLAEELEVDPRALVLEMAPAGREYDNPDLGFQLTGGSTSVKSSYEPLRRAGATARELLRAAAAETWQVPPSECTARAGRILHAPSGRSASYGELAVAASRLPPVRAEPKKRAAFTLIGHPLDRLDGRRKVDGTGEFGLDVRVPGMRVAMVVRCPVLGGTLKSFDDRAARLVRGVEDVVAIPSGVAVVARGTWEAKQGVEALQVEWNEGALARLSSDVIRERFRKAAGHGKAIVAKHSGDPASALASARQRIRAEYEVPYLAHATMEPQNAVARVADGRCEIWAPTQGAAQAVSVAARITGLARDRIALHTTLLGGGFGRRIGQDYVAEAVLLSKLTRKPIQVVFSREDDIQHDIYRPAMYGELEGGLDADGRLIAWTHRLVGPSILAQVGEDFISNLLPYWVPGSLRSAAGHTAASVFRGMAVDESAVEGAATIPYGIENVRVDWVHSDPGVPIGFWRSVGHSHTAFAVEGFIDELAHAAGKDPLAFRVGLLGHAHRNRGVLELAASKAGWGASTPAGVFRGVAQHASFGSFAAVVAEVAMDGSDIQVRRVVCAIDCGLAVNPDGVRAQLEGATIFALSAALRGEITLAGGRVQQSNFNDYQVLRIHEAPLVEVYLADNEAAPTGVGEPGVPPVAPAVANAVFAATGKRLRRLPLSLG